MDYELGQKLDAIIQQNNTIIEMMNFDLSKKYPELREKKANVR